MSQCPQCGTATTVGQPFCGACGATLTAQGSTPDEGQTQIRPAGQPGQPQNPPQQQAWQQPQAPQPQQPPQQQWQQPQEPAPQQPQGQQWGQQQPQGQQWGQQPPPQGGQQWGQQQPQGQQWGQQQQFAAGPQGGGSGFDFSKLLVGNWAGMAMVAGAALGVAFVLGLLFAFTTADDLEVGGAIWTTLAQTAAAFGVDTLIDGGDAFGAEESTFSVGQYPLLATIVAFGVAGYLFRRVTASYTDIKVALIDAVRAGLILTVAVTLLAIVVSIINPEVKGYTSLDSGGDSGDAVGLVVMDGDSKISILGAIFLPLILMSIVLALVAFTRRDWLTGKLALVHDWVAVPIKGLGALIAGLFVLGLIYAICQLIGEKDARGFAETMRALAILPSLGVFLTGLGVFGKIGNTTEQEFDGDEDSEDDWDRIGDFADDHGAVFWVAPIAAIGLAAGVVWYIHTITPDKTKLLRNFAVYLGSLIIFIPILVRFANAHIGGKFEADGEDGSLSSTSGVEGFQTMFFFLLISLIAAAIIAVVTGSLDVNALKAKAQSFQGQPGQPGGQQQWGQQPPQQGGQQYGQPQQQQWGQQPPQQGGQQYGQPDQGGQQWGQQPPQGGQQGGWQPPQQ